MTIKKKINILAAGILTLFIITRPSIANMILSFLLGGVIPGTNFSLPFWVMLAGYLLLMTAIMTVTYERYRDSPVASKSNTANRLTPHRSA